MSTTMWFIISIVGVIAVGVLIYLLRLKYLSKSLPDQLQKEVVVAPSLGVIPKSVVSKKTVSKPATPKSPNDNIQEWIQMDISPQIIKNLEKQTGRKIIPGRLREITQTINQEIAQLGLNIQLKPSEALDILVVQDNLNKHGNAINVVSTAIWMWLDRKIRKESRENDVIKTIRDDEAISSDYMQKRFNALMEELKKKKQIIIEQAKKNRPEIKVAGSPISTTSVMDLIRQEAEFHTRKKLGLGPKDPIPLDQRDLFTTQMKIARDICRKKGYIIPKEAEKL